MDVSSAVLVVLLLGACLCILWRFRSLQIAAPFGYMTSLGETSAKLRPVCCFSRDFGATKDTDPCGMATE